MVSDQRTSRRSVLKTLGAAAAGTVAFTGSASAETDASYFCSFNVPMILDEADGTPPRPTPNTVHGSRTTEGIVTTNNITTTDCNILNDCDAYVADIPWFLRWSTDADPGDVGEVYFSIDTSTPENDLTAVGDSYSTIIDSQTLELASQDSVSGPIQAKYQIPIQGGDSGIDKVPAENFFRPIQCRLELDFRNSNIRDGTVSREFMLCTPNKGMDNMKNFISTTDTLYDAFVKAANRTTGLPLNRLRKSVRLYSYAGSTGGLDVIDPDRSNLAFDTVRSGIAAFESPVEERLTDPLEGFEDTVTRMAGPGVIELDEASSTGCSGPAPITGGCPTDPDGDGLYEDVNGNGRQDIADSVDLFHNRESDPVQKNVDAFDFNDSGDIEIGDAVKLFRENT